MPKTVAVMLGDGFEPVEVVAPVDALRRGGAQVDTVSVMDGRFVKSAQDIVMQADYGVGDVDLYGYDMLMVPGGSGGVENLSKCKDLLDALKQQAADDKYVASICAGPTILAKLGILDGKKATCYPGLQTTFPDSAQYQEALGVYRDGNLLTASGPGQALQFGIEALRMLCGDSAADEVAKGMLLA